MKDKISIPVWLLALVRQVVREELGERKPMAVTLQDAAAALGCSPKHIGRMVKRCELLVGVR